MATTTATKTAVFTIVSNNYLHFARTLLQSIRAVHPEFDLHCVVVDKNMNIAQSLNNEFTAVALETLNLPMGNEFLFQYTILELNTAVKPWAFEYLLNQHYDNVIYIDPDIYLYAKLSSVLDLLNCTSDIVVTPHLLAPINDDKNPTELDIRRSGTYNFGFCAVKNTENTRRFIHWWQGKLETECVVDVERGIFVDQSWIDLVPGLFDNVSILRHPGYNVAYWNLAQRTMEKLKNGNWYVNGWVLVFFHFSGFDPFKPEQFSKHQNRFVLDDLGNVIELVRTYCEKLIENGARDFKSKPYGYGYFEDGTPIHEAFRALYRKDIRLKVNMGSNPFGASEWLMAKVPGVAHQGLALTYAMYSVWKIRTDLQAVFALENAQGIRDYYHWFLSEGEGYFPASIIAQHKELIVKWDAENGQNEPQAGHDPYAENSCSQSRLRRIYHLVLGRKPDHNSLKTYALNCRTRIGYLGVWKSVAYSRESKSYPHFMKRLFLGFPWDLLLNGSPGYMTEAAPCCEILTQPATATPEHNSPVQRALDCWRRREDLRTAFPHAFTTVEGSEAYAKWITGSGQLEEHFSTNAAHVLLLHRKGVLRVLMLYLQDNNLQNEFRFLFLQKDRSRFYHWLIAEACPRNIVSLDDVAWFDGFAESSPRILAEITLGHGTWLHSSLVGGGTVFDLRQLQDMLGDRKARLSGQLLTTLYSSTIGYDLLAQAEQHYFYNSELREKFSSVFESGNQYGQFIEQMVGKIDTWQKDTKGQSELQTRLQPELNGAAPTSSTLDPEELRTRFTSAFKRIQNKQRGVNLAGYFHTTSGMGESARSMSRTLAAAGIERREIPLPTVNLAPWLDLPALFSGELLTAHDPALRVNIIVANGDDFPHVRCRLPYAFWKDRKNIGYWVWETEQLPEYNADADALSEIWTPSEYSAAAIRASVNLPVRVVPHILDFEEIDSAVVNRTKFDIPEDILSFGFFFDCKSVMERKNPVAILKAFRKSFGEGCSDALLVLKVSSPEAAPHEFKLLEEAAHGLNVVWITDTLSRPDTLSLMKSLDVYVSLHRSEGFGLTLAEAMAMGKPVVASAYSGNIDFMTDQNSCLVHTSVIETDREFGAYPTGTRWGNPDIDHAAELLSHLTDSALRARIGANAAQSIREQLDPKTVGQTVSKILGYEAGA